VAFSGFVVVVVLTFCISLRILAEPAQEMLIRRSVVFGLAVYVFFFIGEFLAWHYGLILTPGEKPDSWLKLMFGAGSIGSLVPQLSGSTSDANRAAFILTMYLALLDGFSAKWRYARVFRVVIGILIFSAWSRSGTLCWVAYYLFSSSFWKSLASRKALLRLAAIVIVGSLVLLRYQNEITDLIEAWVITDAVTAKLSMEQGSSGESHILLIQRGFETWLTSTKTVVTGIGFGAAYAVLGDFFQDNKHGNFHDLYVTTLAEMGVPAFVILMFLLGCPVICRKGAVSSIAAIMVFNVSYQTIMEPMFWLVLALLWSYRLRERSKLRSLALDNKVPMF
jgi:hypothetical protein